jgi:hypothetical protein
LATIRLIILCASSVAALVNAGDFSTYRGIKFGTAIDVVAKQADTNRTDIRTVHNRPALIQELDWRPRPAVQSDPVKEGLLSFFDGQLYRIIVTYDSYRVEGMTADDVIEAVSATYGKATKPADSIAYRSIYGDIAPVIARWEDSGYAYNLVRTGDLSSFVLILYSKRLYRLAEAAIAESIRIEAREAPQREMENQKMREEEERVLLRKARSVNKPNFKP